MKKAATGWTRRGGKSTVLLICAALLLLGFIGCHSDDAMPSPVYMANHSGYRLWIEICETQDFCEDTEVFYFLDDSDSLFLGYYPLGNSFWLNGEPDEPRLADSTSYGFIFDMVHVTVAGKTLLLLGDSLGQPILTVIH